MGRCEMMITIAPRALSSRKHIVQGGFALAVEIGVGLVEHDQERIAIERARERDALALAGGEHRSRPRSAYRSRPAGAGSCHAPRPHGRPPAPRRHRAQSSCARCFRRSCRRRTRHAARHSRRDGRARPRPIDRARRRRAGPCRGREPRRRSACAPAKSCRRRSVRQWPSASPATSPKWTSATIVVPCRPAPPPRRARRRSCAPAWADRCGHRCAGSCRSVWESRSSDCRAAVNERQLAIAISIGASARPIMIDAAIMAPAVSSCWMTR